MSEGEQEEYKKIARCDLAGIWQAEGLTQNPKYKFTNDDVIALERKLASWYTHGLLRNERYPLTSYEMALSNVHRNYTLPKALIRTPFYFGYYGYTIPDKEQEIAMEFPRSTFAYIINRDPCCPIKPEHKEFIRKSWENANSAYAIGKAQNPGFQADEADLKWILGNEMNANTQYAYEVGLKLTEEQIRFQIVQVKIGKRTEKVTVEEAVRGYLMDTPFAEAVAQNIHFANNSKDGYFLVSDFDKERVRGNEKSDKVSYAFTRYGTGVIQNFAYGDVEEKDISIAKSEFVMNNPFAFHVAKKLKKEQITKEIEEFAMSKPSSMFTQGLFENSNYEPSAGFREFLWKNRKSDFVRKLVMSASYKVRDVDRKNSMSEPDCEFSYAIGQNKTWGTVTPDQKEWILNEKNHNTLLARALAGNVFCYEIGDGSKEEEYFERNKKNLNSWVAYELASRKDFLIGYKQIQRARENLPTLYARGIRDNPQVGTTAVFFGRR